MEPVELDLVDTDVLIEALRRRYAVMVVAAIEDRRGPGGRFGHSVWFDGNPYALAKLTELVARDANVRLLQGCATPTPPPPAQESDDAAGDRP